MEHRNKKQAEIVDKLKKRIHNLQSQVNSLCVDVDVYEEKCYTKHIRIVDVKRKLVDLYRDCIGIEEKNHLAETIQLLARLEERAR